MNNGDEFYVALFSALVGELGKRQHRWLVMQLAETLATRAAASAELSRNHSADEVAEIAARLIRDRVSGRFTMSSDVLMTKRTPKRVALHDDHETIEAAKKAIRRKFEAWRAVKPGAHWHALFAQKMIRRHPSIGQQRIIEEWARAWEMEAPHDRTSVIHTDRTRDGGRNSPAAAS